MRIRSGTTHRCVRWPRMANPTLASPSSRIDPAMNRPPMVFNGIDGATGDYAVAPMDVQLLSDLASREVRDAAHLKELDARRRTEADPSLALAARLDPKDLAQTGWGVIFARDAD